jgi:hypothetical protein
MTTTPHDVPVPAEIQMVDEWDSEGYRDIFGFDRTVADHSACVYTMASQSSDGTVSDGAVHVANGEDAALLPLSADQARELAALLIKAAAELDEWWR